MGLIPLLKQVLQGYIGIVYNPLFYISIVIVYWQYHRANQLERYIFGIRATRAWKNTLRSTIAGCIAGMIGTMVLAAIGVILAPRDLLIVWVISVLLMLIRIRYLCFAYSGGLLCTLALIVQHVPRIAGPAWWTVVWDTLAQVAVPQLLGFIAVMHLLEALLLYGESNDDASPILVESRRGRPIGGFLIQRFWVLPLVVFASTGQPGLDINAPEWWPLIPLGALSTGVQLVAWPAFLGVSSLALSSKTVTKARGVAGWFAIYGIVLGGLVLIGIYHTVLLFLAGLFAPIGHELIVLWEEGREKSRSPVFVPSSLGGVRVLATLPNSPARSVGVRPGETIVRVNSMPISSPYDVHFAIHTNPAYVRLEVIDERGELRMIGTGLYEGAHHLLGLLLVPSADARRVKTAASTAWHRVFALTWRGSRAK